MTREPRDGGADVAAVYAAGRSGDYPSPYLTPEDLMALSDLCQVGQKIICNIEAFEIDGEFDVARFDFGLYGEDTLQKLKPWVERVADATAFIRTLLVQAPSEPNPIMFQVWLESR